jgi:hypothetical protein
MSTEIAKLGDTVQSGLIAGTNSGDTALAIGRFTVECYDKDGKLKWVEENPNLVVNVGLQYLAGCGLTSTTQITTWYVGLYGAASSNNPAATDTLASHAGWTELTPGSAYTGNRPAATFASATNANPSVVTNTASKASFAMLTSTTVGGAFLCSAASGTSGTLFSASDFQSPGDRSVVSGDTLNVTYTFSLSA